MNTSNKLIINNVTRLYDKEHGIKSISTVVKPGEIVAIIGPNGAGKTTLVKSIAGLLQVSEGDITLSGISTSDKICKPQIGYMQNDLEFYDRLTVHEVLDFICKVKFHGNFHEEINPYLQNYHLFEQRNSFIHELSMGMKRKLAIIMALIGCPKLILLDEPTNGVDTYGIIRLKEDIKQCSQNGSIVILTSHVLDLLEKVCSRCIFLKDGTIAKDLLLHENDVCLEDLYEKIYID